MKKEVKFYHNVDDGSYAVRLDSGALSKEDLSLVKEVEIAEYTEISEKCVPAYLRRGLRKIFRLRNKRYALAQKEKALCERRDSYYAKAHDTEHEIAEIKKLRQDFFDECSDISRAMSAERVQKELSKKVTGKEIMKMSFYNDTLDRNLAWAIIKKTKRPLVYTHGLVYRNPTTLRKPISVLEAQEIVLQKGNLLDISFNSENVHLNTFSGSDMW